MVRMLELATASGSWIRTIANTKIELIHVQDGIRLLVNDELQPVRWQVYERAIKGNIGYRGGYIPHDRAWVYYLIGSNGRRYRYLYLLALPGDNFRIGTREDHGAVYTSSCYSHHRQREIAQECRLLRLTKRQRDRREWLTATEKYH
jgi:hypothetical protein